MTTFDSDGINYALVMDADPDKFMEKVSALRAAGWLLYGEHKVQSVLDPSSPSLTGLIHVQTMIRSPLPLAVEVVPDKSLDPSCACGHGKVWHDGHLPIDALGGRVPTYCTVCECDKYAPASPADSMCESGAAEFDAKEK